MHPVKATFTTVDTPFPDTVKAVGFKLTLTAVPPSSVPQMEGAPPMTGYSGTCGLDQTEITIADVARGTYTGRLALVDVADVEVAPGVEDPALLTVLDIMSLTFPVPDSLSLTLP